MGPQHPFVCRKRRHKGTRVRKGPQHHFPCRYTVADPEISKRGGDSPERRRGIANNSLILGFKS